MKAYLVQGAASKTYCGTQADVRDEKKRLMALGLKRNEISVAEVEVPTSKAELLSFINKLVKEK